MTTDLVRYERARQEIAACARIDEAAELRDKAAAVAAYARQRNDTELEVWFAEIKLRSAGAAQLNGIQAATTTKLFDGPFLLDLL